MRHRPALVLLHLALVVPAQGQVLVNEVMASNHGTVAGPDGSTPDWVELYNAGSRTRQLGGWRLVLHDRTHPLPEGTELAPGDHLLLWCDGVDAPGHAPFRLPREGGTLLLVDPTGTEVHDVFTYPELAADMAFGRLPDGSSQASFLPVPTPGAANPRTGRLLAPRPPPLIEHQGASGAIVLEAASEDDIWYTLDGRVPDTVHALRYTAPLVAQEGMIVRAIATSRGHLPSPVSTATLPPADVLPTTIPLLMLTLDPEDLDGPERGIDTPGLHANHSRKGRGWERPCQVELLMPEGALHTFGAGLRVAGSGSRGAAKRSFKLLLKDRFGSPTDTFPAGPATGLDECLLRADAAPNSFLQHLLIEASVRDGGLEVDLQPSAPVRLVVNGRDRGLYRAMPPKDGQWIRRLHGVGDIDLLEGPAQVALEGDRAHWEQALDLLLRGAPVDELDISLDLGSLVDLACMDLYTGRADHELNVRLWRPRVPDGRWRWVLFDLDLWAPVQENTPQRMGLAVVPTTPYLARLLADPDLQGRLLPRFAALMQGPFSSDRMAARLDSLYGMYEPLLAADHERWGRSLPGHPDPQASLDHLQRFVQGRPERVLEHLASASGHELVRLRTSCHPAWGGFLELAGVPVGEAVSEQFAGLPLSVRAVPAAGWEFAGWKGLDEGGPDVVIDPGATRRLQAVFRPIGSGGDLP